MNLEERVDLLEFQSELLFNGREIDRFLYESKITRSQFTALCDLLDQYRTMIDAGETVHHGSFERNIYQLVPEQSGNYHFCELLSKLFYEEGQWEEVFITLYSDMPKFKGTISPE